MATREQARMIAAQAARRYGLPVNLFLRQMNRESGFRDVSSPAGAQGYAQFMPATARAHGVNPHDPVSAYNGAARMMAQYLHSYRGSYAKALAAYNAGPGAVARYGGVPPYAETRAYVRGIMGGLGSPGMSSPGPPNLQAQQQSVVTNAGAIEGAQRMRQGRARLLAALTPSPEMTSILERQGGTLGRVASHISETPITIPQVPIPAAQTALRTVGEGQPQPLSGAALRYARLAPGADRAGMRTKRSVLEFVGTIGRMAGHPLTIGTGTHHSQMTVNGKISDHWSGHAADIPASGRQLIHLGQLALMAAGMPRAQALKQRGGLYNVGGHQVIFNTHIGGDHTNHLHVSSH